MWDIVHNWIFDISCGVVDLDFDMIRFYNLPRINCKYKLSVILYLVCLTKYNIWQVRSNVKVWLKSTSSTGMFAGFVEKLRLGILCDKVRFPNDVFRKYWVDVGVFYKLSPSNQIQFNFDS